MIRGRVDKAGELIIVVNDFGLLDLARMLRNGQTTMLAMESGASDSGGELLNELHIVVNDAAQVTIGVADSAVTLAGGPAALGQLSEEILEFGVCGDIDAPGAHTHFTPEPHGVVSPGSLPLYLAGPLGD